jgi:7-cyano-7-deazaguanine synthase
MLILYSGGLDSTVLLYQYNKVIDMAVMFDYGSKHNEREQKYAIRNLEKFNMDYKIIKLDFINELFKSDLLKSGGKIPEGHYEDDIMKSTVVPFRNGIMLSIAAGLAESNNIQEVLIANHSGDYAVYPDCRPIFISSMSSAMSSGTNKSIYIKAPYLSLNKKDIALIGKGLEVDFNDTYSCYNGGEIHCGKCGACTERKEALQGFDKTKYLI